MKDLAFDHWDDLLKLVVEENERQLEKWGFQNHDPFRWFTFLAEEVGELAAEIADNAWDRKDATDATVAIEAIQVATLALKIAEMHLYRRQSESPDLEDPTWAELSRAIHEAQPGQTIDVVVNHPRFKPSPFDEAAKEMEDY
jgi:NTP pyrophosphatase (non-canonical NTP hydrolase)